MNDITLKQYYEIFTAAWKLFRTFSHVKTDEDRERLKYAAALIYQKYYCPLMLDLIWAVFNEMDRRTGNGKERTAHSPKEE